MSSSYRSNTLRAKYILDLQDIRVSEVKTEDELSAFHIESSLKSLVVSAKSDESNHAWIRHINDNSRRIRLEREHVIDAYVGRGCIGGHAAGTR